MKLSATVDIFKRLYNKQVKRGQIKICNYVLLDYLGGRQPLAHQSTVVYSAFDQKCARRCALKVINKQAISPEKRKYLETQGLLMMKCKSVFVVKCYQILQNQEIKIFVLEICQAGTLESKMKQNNGPLKEKEAISIIRHIIYGLTELYNNSIIHRDLKPENIFYHNYIYKIGDLGLSKQLNNVQNQQLCTFGIGNMITQAPEVIERKPYGVKADIWSLGVILYYMLTNKLIPWYTLAKQNKMIFQSKSKIKFSTEVQDLLRRMLQYKSSDRISWNELINHSIFKQNQRQLDNYIFQRGFIEDFCAEIILSSQDEQQQVDQYQLQKKFKVGKAVEINTVQIQIQQLQNFNFYKLLIQQIINEQNKAKKFIRQNQLECQQAEFILQDIIKPIQQSKLFDLSKREFIELMYLLSARAWIDVTKIQKEIQSNKNEILLNFRQQKKKLKNKLNQKFLKYSEQLFKVEEKFVEITKDFFKKVFLSQKYKKKQSIIVGLQKIDYNRVQQIRFTTQEYIHPLINNIKQSKKGFQIKPKLKAYNSIMNLTPQSMFNQSFGKKIQQLILLQSI